jgi:hypothetical protein
VVILAEVEPILFIHSFDNIEMYSVWDVDLIKSAVKCKETILHEVLIY